MKLSRRRKELVWWCFGQRAAARATACFHATSTTEAQDVRRLGFRQPIAVIPLGVDMLPFASPLPAGRRERLRLLFLGRIHPVKGLPILLQAWQSLEPAHPAWELVIAGPDEGGHLDQVRTLARHLGLQRVCFVGPVYGEVKDALYRSAELFVLPTHSENFGLAIAEALTYGLPVITTTGAPWQELEGRGCGWSIRLCEANLRETIHGAMGLSPSQRRQMGQRGRLWMQESYSWGRVARQLAGTYQWVLGGGSPPACVMTD
jgi:glycosyltransferase involved in cell wall biosynthesis